MQVEYTMAAILIAILFIMLIVVPFKVKSNNRELNFRYKVNLIERTAL